MEVDLLIEDTRWADAGLQDLAERALSAVADALAVQDAAVSLLGCDDARIAGLNAEFRGKPAATNVLSWPSEDLARDVAGGQPAPPRDLELGDIAIAFETCKAEAEAADVTFEAHMTHLLVHGCLHLLGYDHETEADAALMEGLEVQILATLGVADPY